MTRQALKLRDDLGDFLSNVILFDVSQRATRDFHAVLDQVRQAAGLTFAQYCDLEAAGLAAMGDLADAAFVAGLQIGRDPLSLLLEPSGDDDLVVKGGRP